MLGEFQIKTKAYRCERCGAVWIPKSSKKTSLPVACAKCGSPYWNRPRTNKKRGDE
jgi:DNA-directed RNA polymerase subunit RPC12/RpoP